MKLLCIASVRPPETENGGGGFNEARWYVHHSTLPRRRPLFSRRTLLCAQPRLWRTGAYEKSRPCPPLEPYKGEWSEQERDRLRLENRQNLKPTKVLLQCLGGDVDGAVRVLVVLKDGNDPACSGQRAVQCCYGTGSLGNTFVIDHAFTDVEAARLESGAVGR